MSGDRFIHNYGFILIPDFALMSYASATEPLRAANLIAGREIYRTVNLSPNGKTVRTSCGISVECEPIAPLSDLHTVFVCAGGDSVDWKHTGLQPILRQLAHEGVRIGGISGGPFVLAEAGLLDGRDFTIHWEYAPALIEAFPDLSPRQARFVIDGNRITCGGGVAALDMMHALIAERMGSDFARRISDWYLHTAVAEPASAQRASAAERFGVHHPVLLNILEKMEVTIELPMNRAALASFGGVSERHLDRLFAEHLRKGLLDTYRDIRLRHARRLLLQSPLSLSEIAFATGFSSAGHFSRSFKSTFGQTPRQARTASEKR